jgi:hypothetical protein
MQEGDLNALVASIVTVPPALLIATNSRLNWSYRLLSTALLFLGLAKLVRVRFIVDAHVEPLLARLFWAHNLPVALAAIFAIVAYTIVALTLSTSRRFKVWAVVAATSATVAFLALFVANYGDHFRPYLSGGGIDSPGQAVAWAIPLVYVGVASGTVAFLGIRARLEVSPSLSTKLIGDALIVMGLLGLLYLVSKGGYVVVSTIDDQAKVLPALATVGLISFPASALFLALAVLLPGVTRMSDRIGMYVALKREGVPKSSPHLWRLAADESAAHQAIIDHADEAILGTPHTAK